MTTVFFAGTSTCNLTASTVVQWQSNCSVEGLHFKYVCKEVEMQCFLDLAVIGHEILISRSNILNLLQKNR
jgi:hypothetical protein